MTPLPKNIWTAPKRASYASDPTNSRGRIYPEPESSFRTAFQRDRDRIIHAAAFRKLKGKTQVFIDPKDDYRRTRLTHTLEVAQITRALTRALGLDEDLAETVALAHDLGHTPFGHTGEEALNESMENLGGFDHNDQSLRIITLLEKSYPQFNGLNLTWEAIDGVVKHNGPLTEEYGDKLPTTLAALVKDIDLDIDKHSSGEAQIAAIADDIAYHNHDMHDGLRAGFFSFDDLQDLPLVGDNLRQIKAEFPNIDDNVLIRELVRRNIGAMAGDVLAKTKDNLKDLQPDTANDIRNAGRQIVRFSSEMQEIEQEIRDFLWERMYKHYVVMRQRGKAWRLLQNLFERFFNEPESLPTEQGKAHAIIAKEKGKNERARFIADYLAGMTDRYAIAEHRRVFDLQTYDVES